MPETIRYAGFPTALVRDSPSKAKGSKILKQLVWGDWIRVLEPEKKGFCKVRARGVEGFIAASGLQEERLLELIFVDIGQGDGCLLITPDDRKLVIDAGEGDNMARFLHWRFRGFAKRVDFEAAILSHSDQDHYGGFSRLFAKNNLSFNNLYTNGFMERAGPKDEVLGPRTPHDGTEYIADLVTSLHELKSFLSKPEQVKGKKYPNMLKKALDAGKFRNFRMLSVNDKFVPGFESGDLTMEILGPVPESVQGKPALRWFGDPGKTKNGHSIVVRIRYKDVTIFAGGDLNIPSESLLLQHHAGASKTPATEQERLALADQARHAVSADFAKACHHGSADVSPAFLRALNPLATVISSGDEESFSHPRADTLGLIGKHSRGERPAIFSTELARSAPERIKNTHKTQREFDAVIAALQTPLSAAERKKLEARIQELRKILERSVTTFGAINIRTDGHRAIVAQKIEKPRNTSAQWDVYRFERNAKNELFLSSKHSDEK